MTNKGKPDAFTKEWVLYCEGSSDKAFFLALIKKHNLPDFQVRFPLGADEETGGWTQFGRSLHKAKPVTGFEHVRAILIVTDNDDCPKERFEAIQEQLRIDAPGFGVPTRPLEAARSTCTLPAIVVMMLPLDGSNGNLETSCLISAYDQWPEMRAPIDSYTANTPAGQWDDLKQAKMRIQCIIAARCRQNPYTTLSRLWDKPEEYHIPLDHPSFNGIVSVLADFATLLSH